MKRRLRAGLPVYSTEDHPKNRKELSGSESSADRTVSVSQMQTEKSHFGKSQASKLTLNLKQKGEKEKHVLSRLPSSPHYPTFLPTLSSSEIEEVEAAMAPTYVSLQAKINGTKAKSPSPSVSSTPSVGISNHNSLWQIRKLKRKHAEAELAMRSSSPSTAVSPFKNKESSLHSGQLSEVIEIGKNEEVLPLGSWQAFLLEDEFQSEWDLYPGPQNVHPGVSGLTLVNENEGLENLEDGTFQNGVNEVPYEEEFDMDRYRSQLAIEEGNCDLMEAFLFDKPKEVVNSDSFRLPGFDVARDHSIDSDFVQQIGLSGDFQEIQNFSGFEVVRKDKFGPWKVGNDQLRNSLPSLPNNWQDKVSFVSQAQGMKSTACLLQSMMKKSVSQTQLRNKVQLKNLLNTLGESLESMGGDMSRSSSRSSFTRESQD